MTSLLLQPTAELSKGRCRLACTETLTFLEPPVLVRFGLIQATALQSHNSRINMAILLKYASRTRGPLCRSPVTQTFCDRFPDPTHESEPV